MQADIVLPGLQVQLVARAKLPSRFGDFDIVAFENNKDRFDHVAIIRGDVTGAIDVPVRVHSECLTGDALGSLKCDCRDQLEMALTELGHQNRGVLLYLRQEGRGIGLANKIRAYALQERGLDTVEANHHLGFDDDLREYDIAAEMLRLLGVRSIHLFTNNPRKVFGLKKHGVEITSRQSLVVPPNGHNRFYLLTKRSKQGHIL